MICSDLASRIEELQPEATPVEIARLCLLLSNSTGNLDRLADEEHLAKAWRDMRIRLEAASDQHAATTDELEHLSQGFSGNFALADVLILVRAFKVQSQILRLYTGKGRWICEKFPKDR